MMELFNKYVSKDNDKSEMPVRICAPMVRYSKLPFRMLVRLYDCDIAYTPMIMADSFSSSKNARDSEFTTNSEDRPLIVQFAANKVDDFVRSSMLVSNYCDGVGLNCGCPQRWAQQEGIGACLINKPNFVSDLVKQTRNQCRDDLTVSIKIRLHTEIERTIDLCRQAESAGVKFLTVHGRRKDQRSDPVNLDAIKAIKQSLNIPVVANGDICTLDDVTRVKSLTGVDGVMAARGILENPAMYSGALTTPASCVADWIHIAMDVGTPFTTFHHHLIYMLEKSLSRSERKYFNTLTSTASVIDLLEEKYGISFDTPNIGRRYKNFSELKVDADSR